MVTVWSWTLRIWCVNPPPPADKPNVLKILLSNRTQRSCEREAGRLSECAHNFLRDSWMPLRASEYFAPVENRVQKWGRTTVTFNRLGSNVAMKNATGLSRKLQSATESPCWPQNTDKCKIVRASTLLRGVLAGTVCRLWEPWLSQ